MCVAIHWALSSLVVLRGDGIINEYWSCGRALLVACLPACVCVCARLIKSVAAFHSRIRRTPPESAANTRANRTIQRWGANNILLEEDLFCWQSFDGASVGPMRRVVFAAALWSLVRAWASRRALLKSNSDRMNKIAFYSQLRHANETIVRQLAAPSVPGGHPLFVCHPSWRIIGSGWSNRLPADQPSHTGQYIPFYFSFVRSSSFCSSSSIRQQMLELVFSA